MARRPRPHDSPPPEEPALVTIHGRLYRGVVRGRSWSDEHKTWRWHVEISVDDHRVLTTVSADQIQRVHDAGRRV